MDLKKLQQEVLELLKNSTILEHEKRMVEILAPVMTEKVLQNIYDALSEERNKMTQLDEKKKRIELKYKVMVEKLCQMKLNKP